MYSSEILHVDMTITSHYLWVEVDSDEFRGWVSGDQGLVEIILRFFSHQFSPSVIKLRGIPKSKYIDEENSSWKIKEIVDTAMRCISLILF